jgi:two-component system cell cycle sensor histidine kinase/response regulator CckA
MYLLFLRSCYQSETEKLSIVPEVFMQNDKNSYQTVTELTGKPYENSLSLMFDALPNPAFIMDTEGIILEANTALASMLHKLPNECFGLNIFDLLTNELQMPEVAKTRKQKAEEVIRTGSPLSFEDKQQEHTYHHTIYPVKSSDSRITRLLVMTHFVAENRLTVQDQVLEKITNKTLINAIPGALCIIDANGRFIGWNAYLRDQVTLLSESEMADTDVVATFHPEERTLAKEKIKNILQNGVDEFWESRVLVGGGPEFKWGLIKGSRIFINNHPFIIGFGLDVTDRKQAELALSTSNERLSMIMTATRAGAWEWDLKTNKAIWTDELWRLLGLEPNSAEPSFHTWQQTLIPEEREKIDKSIMEFVKKGEEYNATFWHLRKSDGQKRCLLIKGVPHRDNTGQVNRYVGIVFDITDRMLTEDELRESEKRFRTLFESHTAIKMLIDAENGRIIDANQCAANFYGWSIEELREMSIQQINVLSATEVISVLHAWKTTEHRSFLFQHRRANGSIRDVEVFASKVKLTGKPLVYAIIYDCTERKRLEAVREFRFHLNAMAETHSEEQLLQASLVEARLITGSLTGFCHFFNPDHHLPTLRLWSTNTIEREWSIENNTEESPFIDGEVWAEAFREKDIIIHNDYHSIKPHNTLPKEHPEIKRQLVVSVLQNDRIVAIFGVGNKAYDYDEEDARMLHALADLTWDILARKHALQKEKSLQETLIQSKKMELVGQLAGGIAHDFNNMLSIILGHAKIALDQLDPNEKLYSDLESIYSAATLSVDLTRQLLAFARKQTVQPQIFELNTRVDMLRTILKRLIGDTISLKWIPADEHLQVNIIPMHIDQILVNLCVNARDAIVSNGEITIETDRITDYPGHYPWMTAGDYITLSVTDNGCGIDKEHLAYIFEPFFTTKESGKGTGLGLSIVYGIIKQDFGHIECHSEPGKTTFKVFLPEYKAHVVSTEEHITEMSGKQSRNTILLVEDDPDILSLCKLMLEKSGYTVITASKPSLAIELAEEHKNNIQLLITDMVLPEMDGFDFSKKIQSICPDLKVLFMSGYSFDMVSINDIHAEDLQFIQKPFSANELINLVCDMLMS